MLEAGSRDVENRRHSRGNLWGNLRRTRAAMRMTELGGSRD